MKKSELIPYVSERTGVPQYDVKRAINLILEYLKDCLDDGERIEIRDFGAFTTRERPERKARNPRTGESVIAPVLRYPHFKPGKELRYRVDGSKDE